MGKRFVFAGGGSGGHIYPGLAIAEEIRRLDPTVRPEDIEFVVSDRPLDEAIVSKTGYPFERSPARPMILRPAGLLKFARGWLSATTHGARVINTCAKSGPVQVVAMGGFVAAPVVKAAQRLNVPVTMVNLDAVPGKANRLMARSIDRVFTAARVKPGTAGADRWIEVPPIVRAGAKALTGKDDCRRSLGLDPSRPVLMVTGGSQGLMSLNAFVTAFAASDAGKDTLTKGGWQILHQTGRKFEEQVRREYASAHVDARACAFSEQMGEWWGASDLAICTAGAGNVAEIWMNKVPAVLMPYPHHKDEHQKFNAAPVVECGGAQLCKDYIDACANVREHGALIARLLSDARERSCMRANLEKLGPADGATRIAQALLDAPKTT